MYSPIEATLICYGLGQDEYGYDRVAELKKTEVFVILKSVAYREYYTALEAGIRPTKIAVLYAQEYEDSFIGGKAPSHLKIGNDIYRIEREYQTDMDRTELTLVQDIRNEEGSEPQA